MPTPEQNKDGLPEYEIKETERTEITDDQPVDMPAYEETLELNDDQKKRLSKEIFVEKDEIEKERKEIDLTDRFEVYENTYSGKTLNTQDRQFNLHKHLTKVKIDTIVRYIKKAFLRVDPIISVSPRPEYLREGGTEVCERQQDYIDYKIDEGIVPFESPFSKMAHQATIKDVGFLKITHKIKTAKRSREERYKGNPVYVFAIQTEEGKEPIPVEVDHVDLEDFKARTPEAVLVEEYNDGLEEFMVRYPDAVTDHPGLVKKLMDGKEIQLEVKYEEVVYDDPFMESVKPENLWLRKGTEGYAGMKDARMILEVTEYSWWDLKKEERKGRFFDIDEVAYQVKGGKKTENTWDNHKNRIYKVFEVVYHFLMDEEEEDGEEIKIRVWIEEESKKVIGVKSYPYYGVDCYYIPFWIRETEDGMYNHGACESLVDTNIASNALLNFALEAVWQRNTITPIVPENSSIAEQFNSRVWTHGLPLEKKVGEEVDFLQRFMPQIDVGGMAMMMQMLHRDADDVSGVSSLATGRESPLDPEAPAKKTIALLKQSGINIEEYIETMVPSFNIAINVFLQITYQIMKDTRKFKPRRPKSNPEGVVGADPFEKISRIEMVARTNIQSQAMSFNLDDANEKDEDLALLTILRQEPLIAANPQAVYVLLKNVIKNWSPKWQNIVDELLPSPEELQQRQLQVATQALAQFVQVSVEEAKLTGVAPEYDLQQIVQILNQAQAAIATPPPEEKK